MESRPDPYADPCVGPAWANIPAWEDGSWGGLPALSGEVAAEVCVVGLGGSGLACIQELLRLGKRVVGLDKGVVGGGAAGRNGGLLLAGTQSFYHDAVGELGRDRAQAIYRLTMAEIEDLERQMPQVVRRTGSLRIASSEEELRDCRAQALAMERDGLPVVWYAGAQGEGLLFPGDCVFQPLARCRALAASVTAGGARLFEHSKVMRIEPGRVVCDDGEVRCKSVIVAVDGGLEDILPELVGRVRTARLQMIGTEPLASTVFERPVYSRYGYDYWQQLPDGRVVVGGKRDMFEDAEWTRASLPESRVQEAIERMLRAELGVTGRVTHRWAASVGYTDEPLPVFDQVRPQVWAIGGYSGTGNIIGGLYGRMAAQVVSEGESGLAEVFFGDCYATVSR